VVETHIASVVSGALGSLSMKVEDDDSYLKPLPDRHKLCGEQTALALGGTRARAVTLMRAK
jgi:hypothetical protein